VSRLTVVACAAHFAADLDYDLRRVAAILAESRESGADLVVLPQGTLGGYLADLRDPDPASLPPALDRGDEIFEQLRDLAGPLTVCVGFSEVAGDQRFHTAVCLTGDGILGWHRKVHLPAGESTLYSAGGDCAAFDTPVGRLGMLIDYDKTFPEAARTVALDGAEILAFLCAWPASVTDPSRRLVRDRQARLFDLYDAARAAENQVVVVSSNQTGTSGALHFLGQAKVVDPSGAVRARTASKAGLAIVELDVAAEVARSRSVLSHLKERVPGAYRAAGRS
jgi:predicted amidohydrolase